MNNNLVANELLAFLQQKLDVMDEVSAVQICSTNFSQEDIATAKILLFESINNNDQMVSRRRDGTRKSLQDIITLLKETDPDDVPTFVARDLNKLPPVTFDHVDVTCLLKDLVCMKKSLADLTLRFDASENIVRELRKEVDILRATCTVSRSPDSNVNIRRGACHNVSASSFESANLTLTSKSVDVESAECVAAVRTVRTADSAVPPACTSSAYAALPVAAPRVARTPQATIVKSSVSTLQRSFATAAASKPLARVQRTASEKAPMVASTCADNRDEEGFISVQKKKRKQRVNRNRCGTALTGPNFLLRAAVPTTAVYLSRLHYTTKVQDIAEYIKTKSNYDLRVELLESSHNTSFKSFVAWVPTHLLSTFMNEEYWPKDVVFRRFRGRLPGTSPK